jgi:hypothetical protein
VSRSLGLGVGGRGRGREQGWELGARLLAGRGQSTGGAASACPVRPLLRHTIGHRLVPSRSTSRRLAVALARHHRPAARHGPRVGRGSLGGGGQMRMDGREEKNERNPRNPADFFIYFQLRSTCQG